MCGWITGRNFSSPVGSHLYWNLCPHLPSTNDFKDTCDNSIGFKYADPFSRYNTRESEDMGKAKGIKWTIASFSAPRTYTRKLKKVSTI